MTKSLAGMGFCNLYKSLRAEFALSVYEKHCACLHTRNGDLDWNEYDLQCKVYILFWMSDFSNISFGIFNLSKTMIERNEQDPWITTF